MEYALFDNITNSEDEMILRAGIPRNKACTYLRAYIMASLCFEPHFVISDTSVNLNRAFRTLVDYDEGIDFVKDDLPQKADFDELIREGHIRFAARDKYKGSFSDALRESQQKMTKVDLPSKKYTEMIDLICSDEYIYWYNIDKVSQRFTSKFRRLLDKALYENRDILPENAKLIQNLIHRLSGKETVTYNEVKAILLNEYKYSKEDDRYKYIRGFLRIAYDSNPLVPGLDYRIPLYDIKPSEKQNWKLELNDEQVVDCKFGCDVYGLAKLPASHLKYIWDSSSYFKWQEQINSFREGKFELSKYIEATENYMQKINEVVADNYSKTYKDNKLFDKPKLSHIPIRIRQYIRADNKKIVVVKLLSGGWNAYRFCTGLDYLTLCDNFVKILPNIMQHFDDFPAPPEEIREAVVLQNKPETVHQKTSEQNK